MFGRRRRPILATAGVVGASRSAARYEVANHAEQHQYDQMARELQRRDEDKERRTRAAIDEAIAKERLGYEQIQAASIAAFGDPPAYTSMPVDDKAARYCRQCGYGCGGADRFCVQCGRRVEEMA